MPMKDRNIAKRAGGAGTAGKAVAALVMATSMTVLAACVGTDVTTPPVVIFEVIEDVTFDPILNIDLSLMTELPSGVYVQDVQVGTGAVIVAGDLVNIDQVGWLRNGARFSSGLFSYVYGADPREVIDGIELGMEGMADGGQRVLIVPPEQAYGSSPPAGSGIPAGAVLVYAIELQSIG